MRNLRSTLLKFLMCFCLVSVLISCDFEPVDMGGDPTGKKPLLDIFSTSYGAYFAINHENNYQVRLTSTKENISGLSFKITDNASGVFYFPDTISACGSELAVNSSCIVNIKSNASEFGEYSGKMIISANNMEDISINLSAQFVDDGVPEFSLVIPPALENGFTINERHGFSINVKNIGTKPLTLTKCNPIPLIIWTSGLDQIEWYGENCEVTIPQGASSKIGLFITFDKLGFIDASMIIYMLGDLYDRTARYTFVLHAIGGGSNPNPDPDPNPDTSAKFAFDKTEITFPEVVVDPNKELFDNITVKMPAGKTITAYADFIDTSEPFIFATTPQIQLFAMKYDIDTTQYCSNELFLRHIVTLKDGCKLLIAYQPDVVGEHQIKRKIQSENPSQSITLTFNGKVKAADDTGTNAGIQIFTEKITDWGLNFVFSAPKVQIQMFSSATPLSGLTYTLVPSENTIAKILATTCTTELAAHENCSFFIQFDHTTIGNKSAVLKITADDGISTSATVGITIVDGPALMITKTLMRTPHYEVGITEKNVGYILPTNVSNKQSEPVVFSEENDPDDVIQVSQDNCTGVTLDQAGTCHVSYNITPRKKRRSDFSVKFTYGKKETILPFTMWF